MPYRPKIIGTGCGVDGVHSSALLWLHKGSPELTQILLWISLLAANKQTSSSWEGLQGLGFGRLRPQHFSLCSLGRGASALGVCVLPWGALLGRWWGVKKVRHVMRYLALLKCSINVGYYDQEGEIGWRTSPEIKEDWDNDSGFCDEN